MRKPKYNNAAQKTLASCARMASLALGGLGLMMMGLSVQAQLPAPVMKALAKYKIPESSVSAQMVRLDESDTLFSHRTQTLRNPASVMKLLTSFVALDILGPAYSWKTKYYLDGELNKGTLQGDLIIKGGGDPYLVKEQFWLHLVALREKGLKRIRGDLIIDSSAFNLSAYDSGKFDQQPTRLYNVGPSATMVNFNASRFRLQAVDGRIEVLLDPPMHNIVVDNQLKAAKGKCRGVQSGWTFNPIKKDGVVHVSFTGSYRTRCGRYDYRRAVLNSPEYLYGLFRYLWQNLGGEFDGDLVKIKGAFKGASNMEPFFVGSGKTLAEVVNGTNKYSNNLLARQLLLSIAHHQLGETDAGMGATVFQGVSEIKQWLRDQHLNMPGLVVENGAGLSRSVRMTTKSLSAFLLYAARSIHAPEFLASFPLGGVDGSMRKRLKALKLGGRARFKTGYVKGIRTLAGFIRADSGKDYAMVLFIQDPKVNFTNGNAVQDALIKWALKNG